MAEKAPQKKKREYTTHPGRRTEFSLPKTRKRSDEEKLTPAETIFAEQVFLGKSYSDAYRIAYPNGPTRVNAIAAQTANRPAVANRIRVLQEQRLRETIDVGNINLKTITALLLEDRDFARRCGQAAAATTATMGLAKIHGLMVEDRKNLRDPFEGMTADQVGDVLARIDAALDAHSAMSAAVTAADGRQQLLQVRTLDVEEAEILEPKQEPVAAQDEPRDEDLFG